MVDRFYHEPVMAGEVVSHFQPLGGGLIVDATFGGGGHTAALLAAMPEVEILALDRDPDAAAQAARFGDRIRFLQGDFRNLDELIGEVGIDEIDGAILDLGVSSHQLDMGDRGFSYRRSGPLDMRMGPDSAIDADELVNSWTRDRVTRILREYGEERYARRIAAAIVRSRPIRDTAHLAEVVAGSVPAGSRRRSHPGRRTFQAIRIAVNDELAALADGLDVALRLLRPRGRAVVIAYHSLEDRIVKRRFVAGAVGCVCPPDLPVCGCGRTADLRLLTRRAKRPSDDEITANRRARSARLRAVEKVPAA